MIPYYPGCLYMAGESALRQRSLMWLLSIHQQRRRRGRREQPRGRGAERPTASQMTGAAEAGHGGQGVSALCGCISQKDAVKRTQRLIIESFATLMFNLCFYRRILLYHRCRTIQWFIQPVAGSCQVTKISRLLSTSCCTH